MRNKLLRMIRQYDMIMPGDTVVCAVSGGADSVALLFDMYLLRDKLDIRLEAAHFNHHLRGEESDGDEAFVREFCGHGVGLKFHEIPEVEHVGRRGTGMLLVPGMIFTIEPMINMGERDIFIDEDNDWTVITEDEQPSAQWENTILITETGNEILTW